VSDELFKAIGWNVIRRSNSTDGAALKDALEMLRLALLEKTPSHIEEMISHIHEMVQGRG